MNDAASEYASRLGSRRAVAARLAARERVLSNTRLAVFVPILVAGWLAFGARVLAPAWILVPVAGFGVLIVWHDRVIRVRERADRAVAFYERGLARLAGAWAGGGVGGERFADPHHPYAADLDLFGPGSLFELLCTARTAAGEELLADWLREPAAPDAVRARHASVEELRPSLDLREDLALIGEDVRAGLHARLLEAWGDEPPLHGVGTWRLLVGALAGLAVATLAGWIFLGSGPAPLVFVLFLEALVAMRLRGRIGHALKAADQPARDLALLAALLERLEQEDFRSPRLVALRGELATEGVPASREVARLRWLLDMADARRNQLFAPLAALLLWGAQFGLAVEAWRQRSGGRVGRWIRAAGEIEALCALASHAYEHPGDPFPELVDSGPCFEAAGLGHPLLAEDACIRNDLVLDDGRRVFVVSGSNMSGKSTLLRSVGINAVLAFAGAPVRAARLRLSPLAVGASIRLHDSLQDGESRFYAEIKRLRQVVDLAEERAPALFLLDEILAGTNSHDRGFGAAAVVRGLVERGAIGLVTTHDLALARIADELAPRGANIHFEDHVEDGRIAFDYHLREGVVTKSNALALMREVGLHV
jgi:hypothetical protein